MGSGLRVCSLNTGSLEEASCHTHILQDGPEYVAVADEIPPRQWGVFGRKRCTAVVDQIASCVGRIEIGRSSVGWEWTQRFGGASVHWNIGARKRQTLKDR